MAKNEIVNMEDYVQRNDAIKTPTPRGYQPEQPAQRGSGHYAISEITDRNGNVVQPAKLVELQKSSKEEMFGVDDEFRNEVQKFAREHPQYANMSFDDVADIYMKAYGRGPHGEQLFRRDIKPINWPKPEERHHETIEPIETPRQGLDVQPVKPRRLTIFDIAKGAE